MPARAAAPAMAAADQATQEILAHMIVPLGHAAIVRQPLLGTIELLLAEDRRHGRDRDPLGRIPAAVGAGGAAGRQKRRPAGLGRLRPHLVGEHLAEIGAVGQHGAEH
jgi:hypothetical protein